MDLEGKRFLVIGGAGLIGSHTVDNLLKMILKKSLFMIILLEVEKKTLRMHLKIHVVQFMTLVEIYYKLTF